MEPLQVLDLFPDEILELSSNSIAELRELKTHQSLRSNCSRLAFDTEGQMVDGKDQLHDLVLGERQRPLELHEASADAQIDDPGWARLVTGQQILDACKA